ncbi:MAG: YwiC-like family protein [Frankia sp.]|nr:YwiC-like family protein [Frankia sp.]
MRDAPAGHPAAARPARRRGAARRRFLPPQHGAWGMLAIPYLAGLVTAGYRWPDVPLLVAWLAAYLLSYYVFQAVKSRRPGRYRDQLAAYGAVAVPLTALVVVASPRVLWFAPAYAALFALNVWYAWRRRERALVNDLALVVQSSLVVLVVATIADRPVTEALDAFALCLAYFAGTILFVKTMIRERDNPLYRRASVGYHVAALALAAWLSPWAGILFGWLVLRAALLPGRGWTPKRVGLLELANSLLLLGCVALV